MHWPVHRCHHITTTASLVYNRGSGKSGTAWLLNAVLLTSVMTVILEYFEHVLHFQGSSPLRDCIVGSSLLFYLNFI